MDILILSLHHLTSNDAWCNNQVHFKNDLLKSGHYGHFGYFCSSFIECVLVES
jgi:hypothetical protein